MTTHSLYRWDYDRSRPRATLPFLTFSIAIFQWQPKAAGKGLKRVNASRVHGYEADRKGVYAKAQEICDRLNTAGVDVGNKPSWLKKRYSVPRPKWLIGN
jgi:hypothetical protein